MSIRISSRSRFLGEPRSWLIVRSTIRPPTLITRIRTDPSRGEWTRTMRWRCWRSVIMIACRPTHREDAFYDFGVVTLLREAAILSAREEPNALGDCRQRKHHGEYPDTRRRSAHPRSRFLRFVQRTAQDAAGGDRLASPRDPRPYQAESDHPRLQPARRRRDGILHRNSNESGPGRRADPIFERAQRDAR